MTIEAGMTDRLIGWQLYCWIQNKFITMSMIDKQSLRMTHLAEADSLKGKQRQGFFSVPVSNAIGDDGEYKTRIHPRNETGKPETSPRNFQTSPPRSGQLAKSFLGPLNSLATTGKPDEFVEEPKRFMREDHQGRKLCSHEKQFYPANSYALLHKPTYPYKEQADPEKNPKRFRREDGRVKSNARQLQTNIQSRVISDYFKPIKNVSDPFERKHDIEWERQKQEKAKEAEQPFSPNKFRSDSFNSTRDLFNDHEVKRTRYFHETKFNCFPHERRWKDTNENRRGLYGFIAPFPKYMENPPEEVKRREKSAEKDIFKAMNKTTLGIPSSSITQHPTNLRRSFNHSFSHRP